MLLEIWFDVIFKQSTWDRLIWGDVLVICAALLSTVLLGFLYAIMRKRTGNVTRNNQSTYVQEELPVQVDMSRLDLSGAVAESTHKVAVASATLEYLRSCFF